MKKLLLLVVSFLFISSMALAQPGSLCVFGDPDGLSCSLNNAGGFVWAYVVHTNTPGASGCQFSLQVIGTSLTWVGDSSPFHTIGSTQEGLTVDYGACLASPILVIQAGFMGTSESCDYIEVIEDPNAVPPGIYIKDCTTPSPNLISLPRWATYINDDGSCPNCLKIPIEETTWGQVKALYR